MAGVKDEKSFYKKYPTEAAFLKANPKFALGGKMNIQAMQKFEFGGNEEITIPTSDANRQTYPKTITYSPQEWHQKNILAGNVMLGKNNDLNTMFKNNIYPQYTLPNDTVPINYSPVVKQLPMPKGFVDNNKGAFNYAAGQQLLKQANGGQMNAQDMPQFANGGVWGDIKEYAGIAAQFSDIAGIGYGEKIRKATDQEGVAVGEKFGDTMASGIQGVTKGALKVVPGGSMVTGLTDQVNSAINKPEYNEDGSLKQLYEGRSKLQKTAGGVGEVVGAVGAGLLTGNVGGATSSGLQGVGKFSEGMDTDSSGERKNGNWATASNISNSLAPLAGMVGGQFNGEGINFNNGSKINANNIQSGVRPMSSTDNMGQSQFGLAKYGGMYNMGGMQQYANGGEIQYANGGTGEINAEVEDNENAVGPNGEFTQFNGPTHAQGGIETDMAPETRIFSAKLKMPGSKKSFADLNKLYNTNKEDNVLSSEKSNNTLKLTAMLMRDAKLKQSLALFQEQEQFKQDKVAAYAKRMGVQIPSQDNEQMEPQGMPEQSEGEMAMAKHGGMMNYMAKGGMIKRADGSYSKRGLWDNIRANAGSGKAPTKEMLKQEAKINKKAMGGYMYANGGTNNPGFNALPEEVQQNILANMAMGGQMNNPMFAEGGKLPQDILKSRLESHMSSEEANNYLDQYGEGGYVVKRSNERKGKTHVVIGPDGTKKYFGDPNMGEKENSKNGKEAFYARHKTNLANNPYFRAYAKKTWAEGGITEEEMYDNNSFNYKMGGININPANKGKFTASAENAGMGVQEFANHVLANKEDYSSTQVKRANFAHNAAGWKHEMGGFNPMNQGFIQGINSYQVGGNTDPGKLSDIQRQLRVVKQQIGVIQPDSQYVSGPLAKLRGLEKDLTIRQNNHPEFKKAMGGRLPMYQDGSIVPQPQQQPFYGNYSNWGNTPVQGGYTGYIPSSGNVTYMEGKAGDNYIPEENYVQQQSTFNPNINSKDEGKGFDYKKAAGNLGQYALQNAGNIYNLYRSTQDNSKLNLSRVSPTFLDKTQDLQNNLRMYSEGKRQTAEASQGNASTYLNNMYANRASKLANDLNINTTYGNLNASIDNAAKLYNAGAIDKETMFKLQAEGMNRNLKGQALAGMSQNFLNQRNSNRQDDLDQQRLGLQKQYYKAFYDNQDRENQRKIDEAKKADETKKGK